MLSHSLWLHESEEVHTWYDPSESRYVIQYGKNTEHRAYFPQHRFVELGAVHGYLKAEAVCHRWLRRWVYRIRAYRKVVE